MKFCTSSLHTGINPLSKELFYKDKSHKDGLTNKCKQCSKIQSSKNYEQNKEDKLPYQRDYYNKNITKIKKYSSEYQQINKTKTNRNSKKYRDKHKSECNERNKQWRINNKGIVRYHCSKRRYLMHNRIPNWANEDIIKELYISSANLTKLTGIQHHVHHIIPLSGDKNVCGLHCEQNLIILTQDAHILIHSKYDECHFG